MKSVVVMVAAGACFVGYLAWNASTADLREREDRAARRLDERARQGITETAEEHGYRFEMHDAGPLPALQIAFPLRPRVDGVRWFATDGKARFSFDTVRYRVANDRPDIGELRRHLARPAGKRGRPPIGWEREP